MNVVRIPTYTINDIDPSRCYGYNRIWVHVRINSLKSNFCHCPQDVHDQFRLFMHKLNAIKSICPTANIIVSPILPTGSRYLNARAEMLNGLLFSQQNSFNELNFNSFCGRDGRLLNVFRCYNNPNDYIHLGSEWIKALSSKLTRALALTDRRSYSTVMKSGLNQIHSKI